MTKDGRVKCSELSPKVRRAVALSKTTSKSDTLICKVDTPGGDRVVKIFVSFETFDRVEPISSQELKNAESLDYELQVYAKVIRPLVESGLTSGFVRPIAYATDCSFDEVAKIVKPSNVTALKKLSKGINLDLVGFSYTVLEAIPPDYIALNDIRISGTPERIFKVLIDLMLQVMLAVFAMELAGVYHHDMHSNNIFVRQHPPTRKTYNVEGVVFTVNTEVEVKIFDFDRANATTLPFLNPKGPRRSKPFDTVMAMYHFLWLVGRIRKRDVRDLLTDTILRIAFKRVPSDQEVSRILKSAEDSESPLKPKNAFTNAMMVLNLAGISAVETFDRDVKSFDGVLDSRDFAPNGKIRKSSPRRKKFVIVPKTSKFSEATKIYHVSD